MKKTFIAPECELILLAGEDVITASVILVIDDEAGDGLDLPTI